MTLAVRPENGSTRLARYIGGPYMTEACHRVIPGSSPPRVRGIPPLEVDRARACCWTWVR